jgi:hypothetical protein
LVRRFRKLCWHFNMGRLTKPIYLKLEAYNHLL